MPRYFFDVGDDAASLDLAGMVLSDLAAAEIVATSIAACLLKDDAKRFWGDRAWRVRVRGDGDAALFEIAIVATMAPRCAGSSRAPRAMPGLVEGGESAKASALPAAARPAVLLKAARPRDQCRGMDDVTSQSVGAPSGGLSRPKRGASVA